MLLYRYQDLQMYRSPLQGELERPVDRLQVLKMQPAATIVDVIVQPHLELWSTKR